MSDWALSDGSGRTGVRPVLRATRPRATEDPPAGRALHWPHFCLSISLQNTEALVRTIDEIIANTHKATEEALKEAFEAGRVQATSDLKSKMASF